MYTRVLLYKDVCPDGGDKYRFRYDIDIDLYVSKFWVSIHPYPSVSIRISYPLLQVSHLSLQKSIR